MWLILETSEADQWAPHYGARTIPLNRRPTVAQPSRQVAEQEALRLTRAHPGRCFVVLEAVCAGMTRSVPTHTTVSGKIVASRTEAVLVDVRDPEDEIPF